MITCTNIWDIQRQENMEGVSDGWSTLNVVQALPLLACILQKHVDAQSYNDSCAATSAKAIRAVALHTIQKSGKGTFQK